MNHSSSAKSRTEAYPDHTPRCAGGCNSNGNDSDNCNNLEMTVTKIGEHEDSPVDHNDLMIAAAMTATVAMTTWRPRGENGPESGNRPIEANLKSVDARRSTVWFRTVARTVHHSSRSPTVRLR